MGGGLHCQEYFAKAASPCKLLSGGGIGTWLQFRWPSAIIMTEGLTVRGISLTRDRYTPGSLVLCQLVMLPGCPGAALKEAQRAVGKVIGKEGSKCWTGLGQHFQARGDSKVPPLLSGKAEGAEGRVPAKRVNGGWSLRGGG
jgi:hypothetical protein